MNTEETKILNQNQTEATTVKASDKKTDKAGKAAFAAGGFVAGLATGSSSSAMAATTGKNAAEQEIASQEIAVNVKEQATELQPAPDPEDVLLATDDGIRVAQVDDDASFAEAFADARAQVGPGGTFEWRGNVYSTYYEEEWNSMSAEERADFQSKIDYQTVAGENAYEGEVISADAEMVDVDNTQGGVRVLGVEAVVDPEGNPMTVAAVEIEGDQALLVDVDDNGMMDVIMVDENHDGMIAENEIYDASAAGISTDALQQHMAVSQDPSVMMAYNDGMPDYMNDADVSSMA